MNQRHDFQFNNSNTSINLQKKLLGRYKILKDKPFLYFYIYILEEWGMPTPLLLFC